MRIRLAGALAAAALPLGGCSLLPAVGPDYATPVLSLPRQWTAGMAAAESAAELSAEERARELANWWRQLGDRQLDSLVDEALAGSTDLRLAQARVRQARAARTQASGAKYPSLAAAASANRSKSAAAVGALPTSTLYEAGFDATWEIDVFGGTRRAVEAADADLAAADAKLNQARVSLVAEVVQNYVDLRADQRRLAIARDNLASQDETLQITAWRNQAGLASASDVEQARGNREQTRAAIPDLQVGLAAAENRLGVLLGANPGSLHARLGDTRPLPAVPARIATGIPADVLRSRPDLIAAERSLAAETARVGQKLAQRFPSLSLDASFGWEAYSLGALGGAASVTHALAGALAATLFDGGQLRAAVEIQSAAQEQALVGYEASVLTALAEVESALAAHAAARDRIEARQAAAVAARNAEQLARRMYESGLADFQKLLDTERTRLAAEDNLALAEATQVSSLIQLYKALGGGWTQSADAAQAAAIETTKP